MTASAAWMLSLYSKFGDNSAILTHSYKRRQRMSAIMQLQELADGESQSLEVDGMQLLAARRGDELFLYRNNCPHANEVLDPMGGSVLDNSAQIITCQHHGAEFLLDSGECIAGACYGESLEPVAFTLSNGEIYLD